MESQVSVEGKIVSLWVRRFVKEQIRSCNVKTVSCYYNAGV